MILCPKCSGNNNGSCPTCHGHNYLVAPVEYYLAREIGRVFRSQLRSHGEVFTSSKITTVDYWLRWAFDRTAHDKDEGWGFVNCLAEKRAELTKMAFKPLYRLADVPWDDENLPKEFLPDFWVERAKKRATERVSCQTHKVEITELMCVTDSNNLQMEP